MHRQRAGGQQSAGPAAKATTYVLMVIDWAPVFLPTLLLFCLAVGIEQPFHVTFDHR